MAFSLPSSGNFNFRVSAKTHDSSASVSFNDSGVCTLMEFLGKNGCDVGDDLLVLYSHLQYASKKIAALVASPYNSILEKNFNLAAASDSSSSQTQRDKPKPLDLVSDIFW